MRRYSACIEWLFAEEGDSIPDRIRRTHTGGLTAVEFWRWTDKDLDAVEAALDETDLEVTSLVAEPMIALTDAANRQAWLAGLAESVAVARRLGAPVLIAQAGDDLAGFSREEQRRALTETLKVGADILKGSGVRLGVEPLNTRIDHIGYFLDSTREGLDIVDDVARPEIGIVYDIYHSAVMGERTEDVLKDRLDRVFHVHVADHPGRNEPGSGGIDLSHRLNWIFANGYDGAVGLEYRPIRPGADAVRAAIASLDG
ncbi:hydroxypyruvate isomerase protein [Rhizobium phaseoli]|uniref:Hydroxypyruvate isomerase protein n=2 Tax=Rhizobium TaxID=379 RepID=A0A192TCT0_9HYPH|nr:MULTISPECIES: TIM barrel protein [Rhizobium]ACE92556.1 putative hydroxypyruvate isomerase protein [Rhizobium etli CIAT 652]ANL29327.1 hydroxypyruvate isomerase protein [Rhizobium phaseoli]ANL41891.1 hydroxypyruvate isomerase protein [Rhizobium phaseoli]ANL54601.1 hydroxypyruvate isomerase protein [Rhizobium phaseoli]ANL60878.1 hydroxypyruvate isomerase protein [Rhizobium phaseoli]